MFCPHCGSTLLPDTQVCLHCGRGTLPAREELAIETPMRGPRKVWAWLVGVLLTLVCAALVLLLMLTRFRPESPQGPGAPLPSPWPLTIGVAQDLKDAPNEGWALNDSEILAGYQRVSLVFAGQWDNTKANEMAVVSQAADKTLIQGRSTSEGAVRWQTTIKGQATCSFNRDDALICLTKDRMDTISLASGQVVATTQSRAQAPHQIWISPTKEIYVLSVKEPAATQPKGSAPTSRPVDVTVEKLAKDGTITWSASGRLTVLKDRYPTLSGSNTLIAVTAPSPTGATALIRTQSKGLGIPAFNDGADVQLLLDGRVAKHANNRSVLYTAEGAEQFPVHGRAVVNVMRDVAADKMPILFSTQMPKQGTTTPPPTLSRVDANGAQQAVGNGWVIGICGGYLVTESSGENNTRMLHAQPLTSGPDTQPWERVLEDGPVLSAVCDGGRIATVSTTKQGLVMRGFDIKTGDASWPKQTFEKRALAGSVPLRGWIFRDLEQKRNVFVQ